MDYLLGIGGLWLLFVLVMALVAAGFWLWIFIDVLTKQHEDKLVWLIVLFFFNLFGSILYYFLGRKKRIMASA